MKRYCKFFVKDVLIALTFIFLLGGCQRTEDSETSLALGIGTWAGFGTAIVGMEKGFFDNINVETKILDDNSARHAAFQSGALDIMVSSIDVFAQETAKGISGKAFLVTDESWGGDGVVAKAGIKKLEDLQGEKVAYARGTPSHFLIYNILKSKGLSLEDIKHLQVDDPGKAGDAFLSGGVGAAVTWEPFLSQVAESGKGHIIATTKEYPEIIVDLLIASDKLAGNEQLLRGFIAGWLKTVDFIKGNPDEAAEIMAKGLNIPVEDVQGMIMGLKFADRKRNQHFFNTVQVKDTRIVKLLDEAGQFWETADILDKPVEASAHVSATACQYFNQR